MNPWPRTQHLGKASSMNELNAVIAADRLGLALTVLAPFVSFAVMIIVGYALTHTDWSAVHRPGVRPCDEE